MTTGLEAVLQQQDDGSDETTPESTETNTEEEGQEQSQEQEVAPTTDEVTKEESDAAADAVLNEEPPAVAPDPAELNELRQFIRKQRKEIASMKAKLSRVKESGEVDDEGNTTITYTPLEQMQIELHNVAVSRKPILDVLAEAMEANPKYSDLYEVCTKSNFDDIFEMAASTISRNENRDFNEVLVQLELEVWKKPNPYKYMYSIIKENHPKFKGKTETTKPNEEEVKPKVEKTAAKVLEAKKAPGSVAAAGAGENLGTSAWTAAKIDDLDESELHTVPKEIYQKYMMGKLK